MPPKFPKHMPNAGKMFALCRDQGLGFTPFSPLCGGLLTGKYEFETDYPSGSRMTLRPQPYLRFWNRATFDRIDRLSALASDAGVSTGGLALAWLCHHSDSSATIVGPRRLDHFQAVEEASSPQLGDNYWSTIGSIFRQEDQSSTR